MHAPHKETPVARPNLERIKHVLTGGSVVDWPSLPMATVGDADAFLRVNGFEP